MSVPELNCDSPDPARKEFTTTHWSVVLAAGGRDSPERDIALAKLCQTYWYPLYSYVRRLGHGPEDAQDLTQEFFARVIGKHYLEAANRERGKFRTFLLTALKRFLANEWDRSQRQKRGAGYPIFSLDEQDGESRYLLEPTDCVTPESTFDRRWAMTLVEQVLNLLEKEFVQAGRGHVFQALKPFLAGEEPDSSYAELADALEMTAGTLRVTLHRMRQRYRELLRAEIAQTVARMEDIDEEIRSLFAALSG